MSYISWSDLVGDIKLGPQGTAFLLDVNSYSTTTDTVDLLQLTNFLNPGAKWTPEELDIVWAVYEPLVCRQEEISPVIIGRPTPEFPQLINPVLATIWAHRAGLKINEDNLADGLNLRSKSNSELLSLLYDNLDTSPPMSQTLLQLILNLPNPKFHHAKYTGGHIKNTYWRLTHQHESLEETDPQSNLEAIVLAAVNYKTNLLHAANPLRCYSQIRHSQHIVDDNLTPIQKLNIHGLDLDVVFEPKFPVDFWDFRTLTNLVILEGYQNINFRQQNPYELLQLAYLEENFYDGPFHPGHINDETPIYHYCVENVDPRQIVSYGIYDHNLCRFTYREWRDAFQHSRDWVHPLTREKISKRAINKLRLLVVNTEMVEKKELLAIMQEIEIELDLKGSEISQFKTDCPPDYLLHLLNRLLEVMWRMRGWLDTENFPLTSAPVDDQEAVDKAVITALMKLEDTVDENPIFGNRFMNLPLVRYFSETGTYIRSTDRDGDGLTIRDRINIVYSAQVTGSCIRLTSNWLGATYCYYCQAFGFIPSFDLSKLRSIS